jgi:hypothetical protein
MGLMKMTDDRTLLAQVRALGPQPRPIAELIRRFELHVEAQEHVDAELKQWERRARRTQLLDSQELRDYVRGALDELNRRTGAEPFSTERTRAAISEILTETR